MQGSTLVIEMENTDLNHTVLIAVALVASLTRLIQLLFASLRICVREYYAFRVWLRVTARRARQCERAVTDSHDEPLSPSSAGQ